MPDPLQELPTELAAEVFKLQHAARRDGDGTIAVSQVSRSWRRLALSYPRIWSTLSMRTLLAGKLATFLERSRPLPFELICDGTWSERASIEATLRVIIENIGRFRALELHDFQDLDPLKRVAGEDVELPFLRSYHRVDPCACLPESFGLTYVRHYHLAPCWTTHVPSLRVLHVTHLSAQQELQPLPSLQSLTMHSFPPGFTFDLFPNLETICLEGVSDKCFPHLLCLPLSLRAVKLETAKGGRGDYTEFYQSLIRQPLPNLEQLEVRRVMSGSSDGIQLVLETMPGLYHLEFPTESALLVSSRETGVTHEIRRVGALKYAYHWAKDVSFASLLMRITSLDLSLMSMWHFDRASMVGKWNASLPELRDLTIHLGIYSLWSAHRPSARLQTPRLQDITLILCDDSLSVCAKLLATEVPSLLPRLFSTSRFTSITARIWWPRDQDCPSQDWTALSRIADILLLQDWAGGRETKVDLSSAAPSNAAT